VLESIALRHQIAVLERSRTPRPCLRRLDRLLWILLAHERLEVSARFTALKAIRELFSASSKLRWRPSLGQDLLRGLVRRRYSSARTVPKTSQRGVYKNAVTALNKSLASSLYGEC
jgi:hypothetical protein